MQSDKIAANVRSAMAQRHFSHSLPRSELRPSVAQQVAQDSIFRYAQVWHLARARAPPQVHGCNLVRRISSTGIVPAPNLLAQSYADRLDTTPRRHSTPTPIWFACWPAIRPVAGNLAKLASASESALILTLPTRSSSLRRDCRRESSGRPSPVVRPLRWSHGLGQSIQSDAFVWPSANLLQQTKRPERARANLQNKCFI